MKAEKIVWGLTLVFVGTVLLLDNFDIIDFYWRSVWHFWPLILILSGLNLVFRRGQQSALGRTVLIALTCAILGFIGYMGIAHPRNAEGRWSWSFDEDEADTTALSSGSFSAAMSPGIRRAELHIEGGATRYSLSESTSELFNAEVERSFGKFSLEKISRDSVEVLNFKMKGKDTHFDLEDIDQNRAVLRLNTQPLWDISMKLGAGKADMDLSAYRVASLGLKGGAASFSCKLGEPLQEMEVHVEAGMAEVNLDVPEKVGCKITIESGLSDRDFIGFDKQADGSYITPNFAASSKKIFIHLKGGLTDFEVKRY